MIGSRFLVAADRKPAHIGSCGRLGRLVFGLAAAAAALASPALAQQPAGCSLRQEAGVVVVDGATRLLTNAPGDRVSMPGAAPIQGPWFDAGVRDLNRSVASALARSAGRRPSLVLASIDSSALGWKWAERSALARLNADSRSAPIRTAIGAKSLESVFLSRSVARAADTYVRGALTSAALRSVQAAVQARWPGSPSPAVVILSVAPGTVPSVSDLVGLVASGKSILRSSTTAAGSIAAALRASGGTSGTSGGSGGSVAGAASSPSAGGTGGAGGSSDSSSTASSSTSSTSSSQSTGGGRQPAAVNQQGQSVASWSVGSDGSWVATGSDGVPLTERWDPVTVSVRDGLGGRVVPTASVEQISGGLRVTYTYRNTSASPAELSSLRMPLAALGQSVTAQDLCEIGTDLSLTSSGGGWSGAYPQVLYSPAAVVRNGTVALGVSVEYPILSYRHEIRLSVVPQGASQWWIEVAPNNAGLTGGITYLFNKPMLAPGETRSYVVNVVFADSARWEETLAPYRDFFRSTYGGVRYSRDGRPIAGISLAYGEYQTSANPDGWIPEANRPDRTGFAAAASTIDRQFLKSDRVLVWAPTGLTMPQNQNFPFQFASRWTKDRGPMSDAPQRLAALAGGSGRTLGLWWGHSASPRTAWAGGQPVPLNVDDPTSSELCAAELRAARAAGATLIGLDAFAHCIVPVWRLAPQLAAMRTSFPEMSFCTEGRAPDVLHALAATWIDGFRYLPAEGRDEFVAADRFRLADYLLPGHETWVGMSFDRSRNPALWGPSYRQADRDGLIGAAIQRGFVPVVWTDSNIRSIHAAVLSASQGP